MTYKLIYDVSTCKKILKCVISAGPLETRV